MAAPSLIPNARGARDASLIVLVGPTAAGKTELALRWAGACGGELVSVDRGQWYRHLDAGTAKPEGSWTRTAPPRYEASGIRCHMVDTLDPARAADAGSYAREARKAIEDIRSRGRVPILVGGSGLYLRALLEGLPSLPQADAALRARLGALARERGRAWLHAELARKDPAASSRIPPGNLQRVIRALEVLELTGRPISSFWSKRPSAARPRCFLLDPGKEALAERIRARARAMFPAMLRELSALVPSRYQGNEPGFLCIGYPQALACLRGELEEGAALEGMIRDTLAYAKRQRTWFKHQTAARPVEPGAPFPWNRPS